jgi:hypothetical protein
MIERADIAKTKSAAKSRRAGLVRPANTRERGEQVRVGPYVISRHLSIGKNGKKDINRVLQRVREDGDEPRIVRRLASLRMGVRS